MRMGPGSSPGTLEERLVNKAGRTNWFYMLASYKNGTIYTGSTSDPEKRLEHHRSGKGSKFAATHKTFRVVYFEICEDMDTALFREKQLKGWHRAWKIELLEKTNPNWRDLTEELMKSIRDDY